MRSRILGTTFLLLLAICALLPPLLGLDAIPAPVTKAIPTPQLENYLNITGFSIHYHYDAVTGTGNSSLLDVIVKQVNSSDIGEIKYEDNLTTHVFQVFWATNNTKAAEDNLHYNGTMWIALNYSLLTQPNMSTWQSAGRYYYVKCYFQRTNGTDTWEKTTAASTQFLYEHRLLIPIPEYTYIADTSATIDVSVAYIRSTIWGELTEISSTSIVFADQGTGNLTEFTNELVYNSATKRWEKDELNISTLIIGAKYKIKVSATYALKEPTHTNPGTYTPTSFTFRGPYLDIARPDFTYIGRDVQRLNITVASVWDSYNGYLHHDNLTLTNFTIYHIASNTAVYNGTFLWDEIGGFWYIFDINISDLIEQGIMVIGEEYNITALFHANNTSYRPALNGTSPFSEPFILDRDPPELVTHVIDPDQPTDEDRVNLRFLVSDDAGVRYAILSYYNGTQWLNISMRGGRGKLSNYTAFISPFPERTVVSYLIYVNDTQNMWFTSSVFSYTVVDTPPLIAHVTYAQVVTDADEVIVYVNVTDGTAVQTVWLSYSYTGEVFFDLTMTHESGIRYKGVIPRFPTSLAIFQFQTALFSISAEDVYGNTCVSAVYAYLVQGTVPAIDPILGLLALSIIALAIVILIVLFKIYEQY